jgi:glycosyltransferase involved in cell wall biosynthesis
MKILITAPNLDENKNVSGISSVVRQIIENGTHRYAHFGAGRTDNQRSDLRWIFRQIALPMEFFRRIKSEKPDVVHINTALNQLSIMRDFALVKAAKTAKRPILIHVHGGKFLAQNFEKKWLEKIAERMLRSADAILVLSDLEKNIIEKRWKNLNVKVLENAVSIETARIKKRDSNEKTMIFLGRLHESKGLNEIVEACRILKNENFQFRFKAFGAGDLQDFFTLEMTKILGEKFHFGGVIAGAEKQKQLAESDIFVLPSRYGEGLPMALLEAMAAQCIVIVSEMASIGAVVKDGENGFTIEPRNVSQLVEKLKKILDGEIDEENTRKNARKTIEEKFDLREYIKKLEIIYAEIKKNN